MRPDLVHKVSGELGYFRTRDPLVRSLGGGKSKCFRVRRLRASPLYPTLLNCP